MTEPAFQARSGEVGRAYETQVACWLQAQGFDLIGRNVRHESGVQFDLHLRDPFGVELGVECKASDESAAEGRRGMQRTDNVWKVLGYLYLQRLWRAQGNTFPRYLLVTSDLPGPGTPWRSMLDTAQAIGDLTIVHLPFEEK